MLVHTMKEGITPPILNPHATWGWVVSFTHWPLYLHGKWPQWPM